MTAASTPIAPRPSTGPLSLVEAGADIVDVGGESTRPPLYGQAAEVPAAEEERRVLPVIEAVRKHSDVPLSVDTVKAGVARQALDAGADIVNDISALSHDEEMAPVAAGGRSPRDPHASPGHARHHAAGHALRTT